jgi:hypothetical protein
VQGPKVVDIYGHSSLTGVRPGRRR